MASIDHPESVAEDPVSGSPTGVPGEVIGAARRAFAGRAAGALAPLVFDSLLDAAGSAAEHQLRFEAPGAAITVTVRAAETGIELCGSVDLAGAAAPDGMRVEVRAYGDAVGAEEPSSDTLDGAFRITGLAGGAVQLLVRQPDSAAICHTDWFRIGAPVADEAR